MYIYIYMTRFGPSGFSGPSRFLFPTPGLTIEDPILAVCVCVCARVYTHMQPHTLPPVLITMKTKTTLPSLLLSKIISHAKQQVPSQTNWTPPPSSPTAELTNCTYMSAYEHPVASVYANVCHKTCWTYTSALAGCIEHLSTCMHTLRKKCSYTRACAPMQRCRNFFAMETISNLSWVLHKHCAGCHLPPALLLSRLNQSPDPVRSRNPSKSTLFHDTAVVQVSSSFFQWGKQTYYRPAKGWSINSLINQSINQ